MNGGSRRASRSRPCPPRQALARQDQKAAKLREHQRAEVELGLEAAAGDQAHDLGG